MPCSGSRPGEKTFASLTAFGFRSTYVIEESKRIAKLLERNFGVCTRAYEPIPVATGSCGHIACVALTQLVPLNALGAFFSVDWCAASARERKQERFTALLHHRMIILFWESFYALKRKGSAGFDGAKLNSGLCACNHVNL